jgi:hypothetical protein
VLKNVSTCKSSPVALAKFVWKGKELLEIVRELFEGELGNLLLYYLLPFTLILVLLCPKSKLYLASCPVVCLNAYYLNLAKYAIQNITREICAYYYTIWKNKFRKEEWKRFCNVWFCVLITDAV